MCISICPYKLRQKQLNAQIAQQRLNAASMKTARTAGRRWQYVCNQLLVCLVSHDNKCFSISSSAPRGIAEVAWVVAANFCRTINTESHRKHANEKIRAGFRLDPRALGRD